MIRSFFSAVAGNNHVKNFVFSVGVTFVSAGYSALSTKKGQEFASNYLKNYLSGEVTDVSASDLDGS